MSGAFYFLSPEKDEAEIGTCLWYFEGNDRSFPFLEAEKMKREMALSPPGGQ